VTKEGQEASTAKVLALKGARTLTLQQQYGLVLATYERPPDGSDGCTDPNAVYIMNFEMDGAGACCGLLGPNDRVLEVDGVPAESLKQVTTAFKGSSNAVKVKVASKVVHGGFMLKKGELNSDFQLRFFILSDEADGSILRYYEGRNMVTRKHKGEIKINSKDVSNIKQMMNINPNTGEKTPGVSIQTSGRVYELLCERTSEARLWATLLHDRARGSRGAAVAAAQEEGMAQARKSVMVQGGTKKSVKLDPSALGMVEDDGDGNSAGAFPKSTRL